ncbi:GIY-YIG nuclease family protein [Effusibacillus pohliae]|uniref:GIY-YIG nuclease family protein n=1 Tax=Effusibacillus pohliae TaxID=232270 RepID=UPI00035D90D0|nr:GIY-YIG nuclease family protein [Effusibacillus pohliae]
MPYVYIVECKDGTLYTGYAMDLRKRLQEHNSGQGAKYTRGRGPVRLRYVEICPDKSSAVRREWAIKRLDRRRKQALIDSVCLLI